MKICPRCQKTYSDENLNFCLDDGAILTQSNAVDNSIPATVMMNPTRPTSQPQQFGNQSGAQPNWNASPQPYSMQPPAKKSKSWLWVVGILGGLMLLCGGGFAGLVFLGASIDSNNSNRSVANTSNYNSSPNNKSKSPVNSTVNATTNSTVQKIDLARWVRNDTDSGNTEFNNGEFLMSSKQKNYYFVLMGLATDKTENAVTKVTVKNVNEESTNLGFGLVINSNPKPLLQDYAFLIDSENKKYRIVRHAPGEELVIVGWTRSTTIKDGSDENVLEVRDSNKTMSFYINGELIKTVANTDGYSGGILGLYAGDAIELAFSDLEISK